MTDLSKKTEDELKVIAYDLMVQLEITRQQLQVVNQELAGRVVRSPVNIAQKKEAI